MEAGSRKTEAVTLGRHPRAAEALAEEQGLPTVRYEGDA